jgi:hypothetical protein
MSLSISWLGFTAREPQRRICLRNRTTMPGWQRILLAFFIPTRFIFNWRCWPTILMHGFYAEIGIKAIMPSSRLCELFFLCCNLIEPVNVQLVCFRLPEYLPALCGCPIVFLDLSSSGGTCGFHPAPRGAASDAYLLLGAAA